ncbi:MAG: NAD(P)-dependent oxidoreductase [Candidatus Omnitrophica bacterium]|nr:NAD(P)-dependent oxidoreductase [Candidatus Omnitrophota bacterium]
MKILVTGATGFIGENLVKRLTLEEHNVACLVRKTSNTVFLERLNVPLTVCDILDKNETDRAFAEIRPDIVFHCAAKVGGDKFAEELMKVNTMTTRNICGAGFASDIKRLIYISSVSVISGNKQVPLTDDMPYKASNAYGKSKIEAERIAVGFRNKGLRTAIIRPCMVYGEGEPHALDKLFKKIIRRYLPVLDIPEVDSKLHLGYIDNIVEVLMLAMDKDEALEGTFMAADKSVITIRSFMELLYSELLGARPLVIPRKLINAAMVIPPVRKIIKQYFKHRVYDISRAEELLGYDPKISTEEGLKRTIGYWKQQVPTGIPLSSDIM